MLLLSLLLAAAVAAPADGGVETFLQRVADQGFGKPPVVASGSLPGGWTSPVPLPPDPVLGSIQHASPDSVEIFYAPKDPAAFYAAYRNELRSAGFAVHQPRGPFFSRGGFVERDALPGLTLFCRGSQGVSVRIPARPQDVRIDVPLASTAPFNSCTGAGRPSFSEFGALPKLVVPNGISVSNEGGMGGSAGFGPGGATANVAFGAFLAGKTDAASLVRNFDAQLTKAGWRVSSSVASKDAALSNLERNLNGSTWNAVIAVYGGTKPGTFHARLMASGAPLASPQPLPPDTLPHIPDRISKSERLALLQLAGRVIGGQGEDYGALLLHRVPPDLPKGVPLPRGTLLGSTVTAPRIPTAVYNGEDTLYYDLTQDELSAYQRTLVSSGWQTVTPFPQVTHGFQSARNAEPVTYCKRSMPTVTIDARPESTAVALAVERSAAGECHSEFPSPPFEGMQLPEIVAPSRSVHRWTAGNGGTAASFESALDPASLLQDFAKQLAAQGWTPGAPVSNPIVATQTFTLQQAQKPVQRGILSVYRAAAASQQYSAVIDVTVQP